MPHRQDSTEHWSTQRRSGSQTTCRGAGRSQIAPSVLAAAEAVEPHQPLDLLAAVPNATLRAGVLAALEGASTDPVAGCGDFHSVWKETVGA